MRSIKKGLFGILFLLIGTVGAFAQVNWNFSTWDAFSSTYTATPANFVDGSTMTVIVDLTALAANLGAPARNNLTIRGNSTTDIRVLNGNTRTGFNLNNAKQTWFADLTFTNFYVVMMVTGQSKVNFSGTINFSGNTNGTSGMDWQVMQVAGGKVEFNNSTVTFKSNNVSNGSVIGNIVLNGVSTVSFDKSKVDFLDNAVSNVGGVFAYRFSIESRVMFSSSVVNFSGNSAQNGGGAFYFGTGQLKVTGSTMNFMSNQAGGSNDGGGVFFLAGKSIVDFSSSIVKFSGNSAINNADGGVIKVNDNTNSLISFVGSSVSFIGNSSARNGGVTYLGSNSTMSFNNSTVSFINNSATGNGGAIYANNTKITFTNSTVSFTSNTAVSGGAIYLISNSQVVFENMGNKWVEFNYNKTTGASDGVIYLDGTSSINLDGINLRAIGNESRNGGFLYLNAKILTFNKAVEMKGNLARGNGGAIYATGGSILTFNNSTASFISNSANGGGGVAMLSNKAVLIVTGSTMSFINNFVTINDGGVFYLEGSSTVTFINSSVSFISNSAVAQGGVLLANQTSKVTFVGSTVSFVDNKVTGNGVGGGAIYLQDNSELTFANSSVSFTNNLVSQNHGGVISAAANAKISFTNTLASFVDNSAKTNGGAIYATGNSSITFSAGGNILFSGNKANDKPNDIYMTGAKLYLNANTYQIRFEGGIVATNKSIITVSNTAGGNVYLSGINDFDNMGQFNVTNASMTVANATATYRNSVNTLGNGGALYISSSVVTFANSLVTFSGNSVQRGNAEDKHAGGALFITALYTPNKENVSNGRTNVDFLSATLNVMGNSIITSGSGEIYTPSPQGAGMFIGGVLSDIGNNNGSAVSSVIGTLSMNLHLTAINISSNTITNSSIALYANSSQGAGLFVGGAIGADNRNQTVIASTGVVTMSFSSSSVNIIGNKIYVSGSNQNQGSLSQGGGFFAGGAVAVGAVYDGVQSYAYATSATVMISFSSENVKITSNTISANSTTAQGQGTTLQGAGLFVGGVVGGGLRTGGHLKATSATVSVDFNSSDINISHNVLVPSGSENKIASQGGGLFVGGAVAGGASDINNNNIYVINGTASVNVIDSRISISSNSAWQGGGMFIVGSGISGIDGTNDILADMGTAIVLFQNSTATFIGNLATSGNGGAIYIAANDKTNSTGSGIARNGKAILSFENSSVSFISNKTANNTGGGAIYAAAGASIIFSNSQVSFASNTVGTSGSGGAIFVTGGSTLTFNNSTANFISNSANGSGGAIYAAAGASITFSNSQVSFASNTVGTSGSGGAILITGGSTLTFNNSTANFISNSVNRSGGAIYISGNSNLIFMGSSVSFINNRATGGVGGAGAIWLEAGFVDFNNTTVTFINNYGGDYGSYGGVITVDGNSTISFTRSKVVFMDNSSNDDGGVFATRFNPESRIIFSNSVADFSGNYVNARDVVGGGVINFHHGQLSVIDSTLNFVNNWSNGGVGGGVINVEGGAIINFSSSIVNFTSNAAKSSNGGVIAATAASESSYINFIGSTVSFTRNTANNGGVLYLSNNNKFLTFIGSSVSFMENKTVNGTGGAINIQNNSSITFADSQVSFASNSGSTNGGAIYANNNGAIRFENSTSSFIGNRASNGGAIYINNNSTITFVNSSASFIGNRANQGGTIYIANSVINFAHPNSTLSFINSSATYGGAIYINNANVTFNDLSSEISFRDNNAALDGGAIYIANGSMLTIAVDIGLVGNSANQFGGAIYNDSRLIVDSTLEDIVFSGNIGRKGTDYQTGSDIYNTEKGTVTIRGTKNVFIESGLRGFGDVNKEGSGKLYIDGNSFRFSGNFNQNEGQTIVSTAYFSGVTNINKGSIVLDNGTVFTQGVKINIGEEGILYVSLTAGNSIDFIAGITILPAAGGLIKKDKDGQLNITGDFSGTIVRFEQYAGTTTVLYNPISMPKGRIFGDINYVENSLLQITVDSMYYKVDIGENGRLENKIFRNSAADDLITDNKIRFVGSAGTATFTNVGSELVDYRLQSIGNQTGSAGNYVIFKGPSTGSVLPVRVRMIDPSTFRGNNIHYIFDHVTLDLTEMEDARVQQKSTKKVTFEYLQSIDSSLRFGFNMRYTGAVPISPTNPVKDKNLIKIDVDQLIVNNGDGVFLNMSDIMSYNIVNQDVIPLDMSKPENYWTWGYDEDIKVLDGIQFNENAKATIFGVVYTYNISAILGKGFNYERYTNIQLTITPPPGERLYIAANVTPGDRRFNHYPTGSVLVDGSVAEDYHIKRDFNNTNNTSTTTLTGSFLIVGDRGEAKDIIISGIIKSTENLAINGTSGSFFSFNGDMGPTRIIVQNVTIRDALKIEGSQKGSVLYIPKPETPEGLGYRLAGTFVDAIIKQNESENSGGAVYADIGVLTVDGTKFISNKTRNGSGGAIYMSDVSIDYSNNSVFSGNSAGGYGNGGAIYMNASTMTNNGGQIDFLSNSAGGDGGAIYASNKVLTGFTNGKVSFIGNTAGNSNNKWSRGGAVYIEDSVVGLGSPIFRDNKSTGYGGAIYVSGSGADQGVYTSTLTIVAVTQNVEFSNNKMNAAGTIENNDIYVEGNTIIRLETRSADMKMTGGVQGGDGNSKILKFGKGELNFGGTIDFGGTLEVQEGTLRLGQMKPKVHPYNPTIPTDEMHIGGDLIIREGALWSSLNGNKDYIYIDGNMTLEGILRFYMEFDLDTTDIIEVSGDQGIFIDQETAQFDLGILGHNSVVIGSSVNIMIARNGIRGIEDGDVTGRDGRIEYEVVLENNGTEAWVVITNKLTIDIPGLTTNQDTVRDLLETIGDGVIDDVQNPILEDFENGNFQGVREKLDKISGAFVTNSISMAARSNNADTVMARMTKAIPSQITSFPKNTLFGQISKANAQKVALDRKWRWGDRDKYLPIWVEANINGLNISGNKTTLGDFKSTGYGVQAGADLWFGDYSVRGVYAGVNKKNMKQGSDKTKVIDMELGAYGAYMFNKIGVRGVFGLGVQNLQTERYLDFVAGGVSPKADFYTYSARFAGEIEYTVRSYKYDFKPFIGVQGGYVTNDDIEETGGGQANLIMGANSHLRLAGLAGLKMENKKDNQNLYLKGNVNWYSKAFIGYLFTGNESEYDVRFAQAKDAGVMKITALDEGDIFGGLGAGLEYNISERVTAYTDGQLTLSQYMVDYSLGAGMRYQFDQKKINEQVANMNRPTEEDMLNAEILGLTESKAAKKARLKAEKAAQKELERSAKLAGTAGTTELVGTAGMIGTAEIVTTSEISTTVETSTQVQTQAQGQIEGTDPINEAMQEAKTEVELKETIASFSVTASQFETDSFTLKAKGRELLTELALKIKGMRFNSITIKGHTDSTGSKEHNQQLSIKRAKSVYDALVPELPEDKLKYEGYGQDFPKATNATKEGRAENRRVDIDVE